MMRVAAVIAIVLAVPAVARAATVSVVRPDGSSPVSSAAVMCRGHEADPALTDEGGRATVSDDCREVTCMEGSYVSGHATLTTGTAVCRLVDGVRVIVRVEAKGCGPHCFAALQSIAKNGDRASGSLTFDSDPDDGEIPLALVRPGAYTLALFGETEGWACRRALDLRRAGEQTVAATWREPFELRGIVVGEDGAPAGDIPIRVRHLDKAADEPDTWRCMLLDEAPDVFSAADGSFVTRVDSTGTSVIEAGSAWDPDGVASAVVAPPIPEFVTLRLQRARRVSR